MVEVVGIVPDELTILARQQRQLDEESGYPLVKYYCTPSCENVPVERQRSSGLSYFGGGFDYRSVRYFCPGECDHMPPEPERDTGRWAFVGSAYVEPEFLVNPIPEFGNLSDVRVISGCHCYGGGRCVDRLARPSPPHEVRYFCPDSCLELAPEEPRDTGLATFGAVSSKDSLVSMELEDEEDECPSVKYFCTPSCENVAVEVPRETGRRYFAGGLIPPTPAPPSDDVRYFVGVVTDRVPVERPRETGEREFGPADDILFGYDHNLSDMRTQSGCVYYGGEPCIEVVSGDRTNKPLPLDKYFCPGVCDHMPPETPRDTGRTYFGAPVSSTVSSVSVAESLVDDDTSEQFAFNLMEVRVKTGYLYFRGKKMHEGYAPVRYFCPGSCESLEPEPVRATGSDYFGSEAVARVSSKLGFDANLSDDRTETGCRYFGGEPCIEVRGWDRVPRCLKWTCYQVAGWIESLGFSFYRVGNNNYNNNNYRKRGKAQRVARPACANATAFLTYLQTCCATATYRMT